MKALSKEVESFKVLFSLFTPHSKNNAPSTSLQRAVGLGRQPSEGVDGRRVPRGGRQVEGGQPRVVCRVWLHALVDQHLRIQPSGSCVGLWGAGFLEIGVWGWGVWGWHVRGFGMGT